MLIEALTRRALSLPGIVALNAMQQAMAKPATMPATLLLAPTGSGKTLAFALAMLQWVDPEGARHRPQAVVLAPSRELVLQVAEVVRRLAAGCKTVTFYGGHSMQEEASSLKGRVPDIIVATPGRLADHLRRGNLSLNGAQTLVLDEYDKMLSLGFEGEMKQIAAKMPGVRRLILTSATRLEEMPRWLPLASKGLEELDFSADAPGRGPDRIAVHSPERDKLTTLSDLLLTLPADSKAIVFVNHRESAERLAAELRKRGFAAGLYHGGMEQWQREDAVDLLANGSVPILVATDLAARGLDIPAVDSVVHYHLPPSADAWTHRNGRTARQQADGNVYVIFAPEGEENVPEWVATDRPFAPKPSPEMRGPRPATATLRLSLGRKDKISKGDVVGYLTSAAEVPLTGAEIGRITLRDRSALAAVPRAKAGPLLKALATAKIKGKSVKLTRIA